MFASLLVGLALAASPMPPGERAACHDRYGQRICTTPALAPLRAEIAQKFAAVLATGNRSATWQARHDAVLREVKGGRDYESKRLSDDGIAQIFRDHIADLDKAIEQAKGVRTMVKTPSATGDICMSKWLDRGCRVTASGVLRAKDGRKIYWQMQDGASGLDGIGAGIILWAGSGYGTAKLIGYSFDGVTYESPRMTGDGMIWVPGRVIGTGNGNADLLFRFNAVAGWGDIELESWWSTLPARLPKGFGVWKGVEYDFEGLAATSKLWRDKDPNCCPSGGEVMLDFEIEGRKLVLNDVRPDIVEK
ncbi:hypothetical protein [Sphingomonas sp. LT1P40]|uniref:hypothetical protein n=1 Tax=Alteristakelama amylovorans TaxID=3096166 RepID=UPI002FCA0BDD